MWRALFLRSDRLLSCVTAGSHPLLRPSHVYGKAENENYDANAIFMQAKVVNTYPVSPRPCRKINCIIDEEEEENYRFYFPVCNHFNVICLRCTVQSTRSKINTRKNCERETELTVDVCFADAFKTTGFRAIVIVWQSCLWMQFPILSVLLTVIWTQNCPRNALNLIWEIFLEDEPIILSKKWQDSDIRGLCYCAYCHHTVCMILLWFYRADCSHILALNLNASNARHFHLIVYWKNVMLNCYERIFQLGGMFEDRVIFCRAQIHDNIFSRFSASRLWRCTCWSNKSTPNESTEIDFIGVILIPSVWLSGNISDLKSSFLGNFLDRSVRSIRENVLRKSCWAVHWND